MDHSEMTLRRHTNKGANTTDQPLGPGGVTKHCMSCDTWRLPGGFKKNKRTVLMDCAVCVEKKAKK